MTPLYRVALLGFGAFERNMLASCFRLATQRARRYEIGPILAEADWVVAEADHEPSVQLVLATERLAETLFVGSRRPDGARAWLARPLEPLRVLAELDAMAAGASRAPGGIERRAAAPRASGTPATSARRSPPSVPQPTAAPPPDPLPPMEFVLPPAALRPVGAPTAAPVPPTPAVAPIDMADLPPTLPAPRALVVDDSDVAQRFLQLRLAAYGIVAECVATSQQALDRLLQRSYEFVFVDLELGPASPYDGLGLCQRIRREFSTRMPPAQIIVVTAHHGELDRVRATLAGSDGFLGKPLDEVAFDRLLARQGFVRQRGHGTA